MDELLSPDVLGRLRRLLEASLEEDIGSGDLTSAALIPEDARARGVYVAKEPLVVCGLPVARELSRLHDPGLSFRFRTGDGDSVRRGTALAEIEGNARSILAVERSSLNFLQRLSGVASLTRRYVDAVAGTKAVIVDTRKTMPGHRILDKYAVRAGGGVNHRVGLFDAILIKNNHLEFSKGASAAVDEARRRWSQFPVQVEVRDVAELESALAAKPDAVLLDNFTPTETAGAVALVGGRAVVESSGGITLDNVRMYAEAGVDRISVGALTHSAPASDIHLRVTRVD